MKILDIDGNEIMNPDLEAGHLEADRVLVAHHEAVPAVERQTHQKVIWQDPDNPKNKLYQDVVDQEYIPAKDAWDEHEDIMRYIPYTQEEIAEREEQKAAEQAAAAEAAAKQARLDALPDEVDAHDEAIVSLYEGMLQMQAEQDEAITTIYETLLA